MGLHPPSKVKELLNSAHLRQIRPGDIGNAEIILQTFPDLAGDPELGIGNDGDCQSWVGDWGWHRKFLREHNITY